MNDNYGVVGGIGEGIKIGLFFLHDIICLAIIGVPGYLISQLGFPPTQGGLSLAFFLVSVALAFYMDMHPRSNPGKRNYQIILMLLKDRKPTAYKSLGYYDFR